MNGQLYRFRSVEALLGERNELRDQHIYFASPSQLNDPMEGFSDVLWQGDAIVWENLLRHYLVCLERAYSLLVIGGETQPISWNYIPVVDPGDDRAWSPQHRAMHDSIFARFFSEPVIGKMIAALAGRGGPVRRHELSQYLGSIHHFALLLIREEQMRRGLAPVQGTDEAEREAALKQIGQAVAVVVQLKMLKADPAASEDSIDLFLSQSVLMNRQIEQIHFYNNTMDAKLFNRNFVFIHFTEGYVDQVERNLYQDWYAACFMGSCSNSSIWGSYGENHAGICLRFKTTLHDGKHSITLTRPYGIGTDGLISGSLAHDFQKVEYTNKHVSIDFFECLGRLPAPTLDKYWYCNAEHKRSSSADAMHRSQQEWRDGYWKNFTAKTASKLKDWRYEDEYRLILTGELDFSTTESRKATYDFESLDGIVFGIKTPLETKLAISRIIEEKCRATGRTDFKFFQAYYARSKGVIEHHDLSLLKFTQA